LRNTITGEETEIGGADAEKVGVGSADIVTLDGTVYVLYAQKAIDFYNLRSKSIAKDTLFFECLIMFIMLFLAGIALHFRYVKPLTRLKDNIKHYDADKLQTEAPVNRKDEIGQLERSFLELSSSLAEEKQMQRRIIGSISHDIKTPLTSVMGYAERLMKRDFDNEKQKQYLHTIYTQAKDIEAIVMEFEDYLGNNTESKLDMKLYETAYICKMLSEEYEQQLSECGIQFSVKNSCGAHSKVRGDMAKLRRVFANIIGNSIRHAHAEKLSIVINSDENEAQIRFTILDNGQGVPESELPYIFEPFYTSDKSRRVSGLGLSICQSIVNAHGGQISAVNNQCGGLSISMELPRY
jgi:signal transduction histidine kinase